MLAIIALLLGLLIWTTVRDTPAISDWGKEMLTEETQPAETNANDVGKDAGGQGPGQSKTDKDKSEIKPVPTPTSPPRPHTFAAITGFF